MRNSLSKQLVLLLTTVFIVEVGFICLAAVIGQSFLKKLEEDELKTYVTSLPPLISESLILQKVNGNTEAFDFLIYEIIQTRKLNYAGFFLEEELKARIDEDRRYRSCSKFLITNYCNPFESDLVFGTTRLEFEGRLIGYVLQEASRSSFTSHLDPSVVLNLGICLVVAFILNIIAVLFFFRKKVSKNLEGIRKLIQGFNQEKDLPDALNNKINLTEFEEIANTLRVAYEIRRENLRTRDVKIQADTLMSTVQMIAHDVRRPFSLLSVSLDALTNSNNQSQLMEQLLKIKSEVRSSTTQINSMLEDLLEVGRKSSKELAPVNIVSIVNDSIVEISRMHAYPEIAIEWEVSGNLWVKGDRQRLLRVVVNIITNAIEATNAAMKLTVKIHPSSVDDKQMVKLEITNNKTFIESSEREKIFDFFHTKGKKGGTGLGLTIARRIIENHGGSIYCTSENQTPSTTFHILLQASIGETLSVKLPKSFRTATLMAPEFSVEINTADRIKMDTKDLEDFVAREKRRAVVLLIDDDVFYREFSVQLLATHPIIGSMIELHCLDAVNDLEQKLPPHVDILLCDLNFGTEEALDEKALANLYGRFPQAVVLIHSDDEWRGRELAKSGHMFLPKPLDAEKFVQAIISISNLNRA